MRKLAFVILLCLPPGVVAAQDEPSLGDAAREHRQKQQKLDKDRSTPRKVITNEDIPSHTDSPDAGQTSNNDEASPATAIAHNRKSAEQWKSEILAQKNVIATLKSRIDQLNDSIRFVEANQYANGVEWNEIQIKKQQEVERGKKQLEEQQRKLENMQEKARQQGFGSAVYDVEN